MKKALSFIIAVVMLMQIFVFKLPNTHNDTLFILGPYIDKEIKNKDILEFVEKMQIPNKSINYFREYIYSAPIISDETKIFSIIDTFAEIIWGGSGNYVVENFKNEDFDLFDDKNELDNSNENQCGICK